MPEIIELIEQERVKQQNKWNKPHSWGFGDCSSNSVSPETKSMVLSEECGEVAKAVLELNKEELKKELVQTAAVCCAWLENILQNDKLD